MIQFCLRAVEKVVRFSIKPEIDRAVKNLADAPVHCGEPMDFIGEHVSLVQTQRTYQCEICKTVATL